MTRPNRHCVQRQIVDLHIGHGVDSQAVHRELAQAFWDRALPELERAFDQAARPHERLRLDRLELDLGRLEGADWALEFRRKLVSELTRTLAQFTAASEPFDENAATDPPPAEPWEQFLFFLVHGRLPWWGTKPRDGWTAALSPHSDTTGWAALRETALGDPGPRLRLVHSVDNDFLDAAVSGWSGLRHAARVFEQLTPASQGAERHRRWRRGFWMTVLDWIAAGGFASPRGGPRLVRDLLALRRTCLPESERERPLELLARHPGEQGSPHRASQDDELPDPWRQWLLSEDEATPSESVAPGTRTHVETRRGRPPQSPPSKDGATPNNSRRPREDAAIFLGGAGAILLHPFLEQLFRERGLLVERTFRDVDARHRAVQLLGLLTFGRDDSPEYELVLAKLLCGVPLEEPLEAVSLENDDVLACDMLLRAVLEHWKALRSSSPAWLREQFLLRDGKLEIVDGGYLLTVERRAQDVLLARLPWGCGVVGFPWLTGRMFVRWLE